MLTFSDSNLNQLAALPLDAFTVGSSVSLKLFYSLDGKRLYVVPDQGIGVSSGDPI